MAGPAVPRRSGRSGRRAVVYSGGIRRLRSCTGWAVGRRQFPGYALSLGFNLRLLGGAVLVVLFAGFLGDRVAGCRAAGGAFGASGSGPSGFRDMCRGADLAADVPEPAADPAGGGRPSGAGWFLPGAAQVTGQRPGDQQLGVGGHDQPDPPVGLVRGADLGGGQPESSLQEPESVLFIEAG